MDVKNNVKSLGEIIRLVLGIGAIISFIGLIIFGVYEIVKTNKELPQVIAIIKGAVDDQHLTDLNQKAIMTKMNSELKTLISLSDSKTSVKLAMILKSIDENTKNNTALNKTVEHFIDRVDADNRIILLAAIFIIIGFFVLLFLAFKTRITNKE